MKVHIAINGACGRMGQRLKAPAKDDPHLQVVAAIDSATNSLQGHDAGEAAGVGKIGVPIRYDIPLGLRIDALIDFSAPAGTMNVLPVCADRQFPSSSPPPATPPNRKRKSRPPHTKPPCCSPRT